MSDRDNTSVELQVWEAGRTSKSGPRRRLTSMQRRGGELCMAKLAGKHVLIWCGQHGAWWRPERGGYTTHRQVAGVYRFEAAWAATNHFGPEKKIIFEVVK